MGVITTPVWILQQSLLRGWLPAGIALLAWAPVLLGVAWWRRQWWHWLVVAAAAGTLVAGSSWLLSIPSRVGGTFPASFFVWVALPLFALGAALWQWQRVHWWRRVLALAAVPGLVAFGGLQINAHYEYLPTVRDLLGARLPGQVSARRLNAMTHGYTAHPVRASSFDRLPSTGVLAQFDIPATVSRFPHRGAWVWLPPIYFRHHRPHLPVLMLLPGTPGSTGDWLHGGRAADTANAYAARHHGEGPIRVFPDGNGSPHGDTECVNSARGAADTYLSVDVPNFVESQFGASTLASQWAVGGLSEGGTCALELASLHPDRFQTFADFSGDATPTLGSVRHTVRYLFGGSWSAYEHYVPANYFRADAAAGVQGVVAAGSGDSSYRRLAQQVVWTAARSGESVHLDMISGGGHDFRTWARALRDAFPWIVQRVGVPNGFGGMHVHLTSGG